MSQKFPATSVSIVVASYNEAATLTCSVERVIAAFEQDPSISLEIVIVDDGSKDGSEAIARELAAKHRSVRLIVHEKNSGKGAALQTGFSLATGDFVAIHDADLEYDPTDLLRLLEPLRAGLADVVYGSRFQGQQAHRVLYFWHSLGNKALTFVSNMFTDLNLTDMETCYKVFKSEVIKSITLKEKRFGIEPEMTAKIADQRARVYEMGISYYGRTYEEGKKIGLRDAFRAMYCIMRYNAHRLPWATQLLVYTFIGGICAVANLLVFLFTTVAGLSIVAGAAIAFVLAAALNYGLCIALLFRHNAQWSTPAEVAIYIAVVLIVGIFDVAVTHTLVGVGFSPLIAKALASISGLVLNFAGRRWLVFANTQRGPWRPQH